MRFALLFASATIAIFGLRAQPVVLFDNLAATTSGASSVWFVNSVAQPFSTGSIAVDITKVTLHGFTLSTIAADTFKLSVYASSSGYAPGSLIETLYSGPLSGSGFTSATGNFDFVSSVTLPLAPSAVYWIVAESAGVYGSNPFWWHTDQSLNALTSAYNGSGGTWTAVPNWQEMMKVEAVASAVPEASTWPLVAGLSAIGLAQLRRRFRHS